MLGWFECSNCSQLTAGAVHRSCTRPPAPPTPPGSQVDILGYSMGGMVAHVLAHNATPGVINSIVSRGLGGG